MKLITLKDGSSVRADLVAAIRIVDTDVTTSKDRLAPEHIVFVDIYKSKEKITFHCKDHEESKRIVAELTKLVNDALS